MKDITLKKKLEELTQAISRIAIPIPAIPSIPAIPAIPAISAIPAIPQIITGGDHDLLQRIDTKLERVITDVQKLNDNYSSRIDKLETNKVEIVDNDKVHADFENRLRVNEKFQDNFIGKMSIITAIVAVATSLIVAWIKSMLHL